MKKSLIILFIFSIGIALVKNEVYGETDRVSVSENKNKSPTAYPTEDPANWMSYLKNSTPLQALSIPGTHDSMAYQGDFGSGIIGKLTESFTLTQELSLIAQLGMGVRYIDIRIDVDMSIHHGIIDLDTTLPEVLETVSVFLAEHPTETIFARMAWENTSDPFLFDTKISPILEKYKSLFYSATSDNTLGMARSSVVVFDNTGSSKSFVKRGIAYDYWNYSSLVIQDEYKNPSYEWKKKVIDQFWQTIHEEKNLTSSLFINHISATGSIPFGKKPRDYATELNPWTTNRMLNEDKSLRYGVVVYDFIKKDNIDSLIKANTFFFHDISSTTLGDMNADGVIDLVDYAIMKAYLKNQILPRLINEELFMTAADLNQDGEVTLSDLGLEKMLILDSMR